jgi:hypothetical protein
MLLHTHVAAMCLSLAHSVFLGAFQEALIKAVEDLKKSCTNCVYVWNKYVHCNLTFYVRNPYRMCMKKLCTELCTLIVTEV